ncbi:hypothetical protein H4Q26_012392 [Puccinia striiformis f. sp. tritici PST-130]|nr:hypothetical protein H4Q26_012392 [Puccinia striiformis f. sp. tritici PST-130]
MAPTKKVKKSAENINSRLALTIKSGKYSLGYKSTLKSMRSGKAKLVLISGNTPPLRRSEIEYYAMLSKTPVHLYQGSNVALGTASGKLFRVGILTMYVAKKSHFSTFIPKPLNEITDFPHSPFPNDSSDDDVAWMLETRQFWMQPTKKKAQPNSEKLNPRVSFSH